MFNKSKRLTTQLVRLVLSSETASLPTRRAVQALCRGGDGTNTYRELLRSLADNVPVDERPILIMLVSVLGEMSRHSDIVTDHALTVKPNNQQVRALQHRIRSDVKGELRLKSVKE